jgi:hypothetical protein
VAIIVKNKPGNAQGRLVADADEDRPAEFCIATFQGAMLMGKSKRNPRPAEAAAREALAHLRRYFVRADLTVAIEGRHEAEFKLLITSLSAPNEIVSLP